MRERGFTLIELLVALVLTALISGSLYQLLLSNQRLYRQQTERVEMQGNVRSAVAMLPSELLELDAGDPIESDVVTMAATLIRYKAMRNLFFLCQPPVDGGSTGSVTLWADPSFGLRGIESARDSVVIFVEGDPSTRTDNFWLHANVTGPPVAANLCPGAGRSLTVALDQVTPGGGLGGVEVGAPLRSFETVELFTYPDVAGDLWLGTRAYTKGSGWGSVQPVLGPVAAGGLQFAYFDSTGAVAATPGDIARVGVQVIGRTKEVVHSTTTGDINYVLDTLTTQVALRNNPR